MLAKIVADIVVACSTLGAALGLLDLLLSSEQKAKLSDASLRLWNWLDEAKQVSFIEMLRPRKVRIVLSLAAAICMLATAASEYGYQDLALNLRSPSGYSQQRFLPSRSQPSLSPRERNLGWPSGPRFVWGS
jgi:hypothetical protein